MGLIWGASFLFMKVALEGVSFGQIAWSRLVLGALALAPVILISRTRLPRSPRVWGHFLVVAITGSVLPYLLFAWAEQYVSSGLASIYNATTPIATALIATLVFRVERLTAPQVAGIAAGLVGVLVIIGPVGFGAGPASSSDFLGLAGQLACVGSALCYGVTFSYLRRFVTGTGVTGVTIAFLQIGLGAVVMLLLTPVIALGEVTPTVPVVVSLVLLGVLGTGLAYLWNVNVLLTWGPTAASTVTFVTPIVGVLLGVLVLGERLSWNQPVGGAIILLGILLAQGRLRRRRSAPAG